MTDTNMLISHLVFVSALISSDLVQPSLAVINGKIDDRGLITKKILRLSYDVIITYDNRKSNLR